MDAKDQKELLEQARGLATFGFEHGFRQAIDIIRGVAEEGKHEPSRETAKIFVALLEKCLPEMLKAAPDMFEFKIIQDADGNGRITFH